MMWKNKNGQYICFNIEMHFDRKTENVFTLFYYMISHQTQYRPYTDTYPPIKRGMPLTLVEISD